VTLSAPVEETISANMGSTSRTSGSSMRSNTPFSYGNVRGGGVSGRSRGAGQGGGEFDPRRALTGMTQTALEDSLASMEKSEEGETAEAATEIGQSARTERFSSGEIFSASQQGAPIHITYNLLHNLLLVKSSDEIVLREIESLIREMDRPPRQVLLEMRILEVQLGRDFHSVFDIGASDVDTYSGPFELGFGSGASPSGSGGPYARKAVSLGNFMELSDSTAVWQVVSNRLRMRLQLMERENRVNVLATPMVIAANNQQARLFIGSEETLLTGASTDSTTGYMGGNNTNVTMDTELRNVGQTLIILPRINADRSVTLTIDQDNSYITRGATTLPVVINNQTMDIPIDSVTTANLQVTAHARDGMTVAVGGMIRQSIQDSEDKVPFLGDIPLLGTLFKKTVRENSRRQIVLLITPWIMENPEESDAIAHQKENEALHLDRALRPQPSIFEPSPLETEAEKMPASAAQP
jgi:general secretion pathway protein D